MAAQSLLAKLGMRSATLGTAASLAIAAPLVEGDVSMDAHTSPDRIGFYFERTPSAEKIGFVTMGVEALRVGAAAVTSIVRVNTPASTALKSGLNIGEGVDPAAPINGDLWITPTGAFARINGVTQQLDDATGITGTLVAGRVPFASGAQTLTDDATMTYSVVSGLTVQKINFAGSTSGSASIKVAAVAGTPADIVLPTTNGTAGFVLSTDGAGITSWISNAAAGATLAATQVGFGDAGNLLSGSPTMTYSVTTGLAINPSVTINQAVATTGSPTGLMLIGAAHTTLTASVEADDVDFALNRTVQFATGALTTQRAVIIRAPTYAFVAASTITNAATVAITGAPAAGTNATITNAMALWVQSGRSRMDDQLYVIMGMPLLTTLTATLTIARDTDDYAFVVQAPNINFAPAFGVVNLPLSTGVADGKAFEIKVTGESFGRSLFYSDGKFGVGPGSATRDVFMSRSGVSTFRISSNGVSGVGGGGFEVMGRGSFGSALVANTQLNVTQAAVAGDIPKAFLLTGGAHTTNTLSTEVIDVDFALNRTVQWSTGALTTQRAFVVRAPTYAFVAASTITNAATVAITGAPAAGTNATITNAYALWVQANRTQLDGGLTVTGATNTAVITQSVATTGSPTGFLFTGGAHTTLTASTEAIDVDFALNRTVQFSTGAITTQRAVLIRAPTYAFVGASTISNASTLEITGPPIAGTNATLTASGLYALKVTSGRILVAAGTAALPTITFTETGNDTGLFSVADGSVGITTNGGLKYTFANALLTSTNVINGPVGTAAAPTYSFTGDTNTGMFQGGADIIGFTVNGVLSTSIRTTSTQALANLNVAPAAVASGSSCAFRVFVPGDTGQTASVEANSVLIDLGSTKQFATGALTNQRAFRIVAPTYAFVGASTITNAATFSIGDAPAAGANATITNAYAFWVQAGISRFDGAVQGSSSIFSVSATAGIGYGTGAGGTVAQATSKATGVTLNKVCGQITMDAANLAATTSVGFTLTNSAISATDVVLVNIKSGATADSYTYTVDAVAAGSCRISLRNFTAGALAEAVVLTFAVIKAVIA